MTAYPRFSLCLVALAGLFPSTKISAQTLTDAAIQAVYAALD